MEGVPRLYMIGLPAKQCISNRKPDFASVINHLIQQLYSGDPSLYSSDVDALHGLRQSAMEAVMSSVSTVDGCTALKRYYAHLVQLTDKFPKLLEHHNSRDSCEDVAAGGPTQQLTFTWKRALGGKSNRQRQTKNNLQPAAQERDRDIDATTAAVDYGNIAYEMRCLLYNLGAAHSRLAAAQDRLPPLVSHSTSITEGEESTSNTALKIACTHLQCAAWAFQELLNVGETKSEHHKWDLQKEPPVTSRAVLEFSYNVSLAQAQECILEKSMMDGRKPLIIAKVSAMICEYFAGVVDAVYRVDREPNCVSANRLEKWRLYSEFKCRYYGAVTALFQGQHVQDNLQQMGTRVSYYRRAMNLLNRANLISEKGGKKMISMAKDDDSADDDYYYYLVSDNERGSARSAATKELEMRRDTLSFALDVATAKWRAAKSENELIYHESVMPMLSDDDDSDCLGNNSFPNRPRLDRVKGASLVRPIGFGIDDPELLTIVVTNNDTSFTTTTLFKDLIPAAIRQRAAMYRAEKRILEAEMSSLCQDADDRLTSFTDTLNLECLDMYKGSSVEQNDNGNEKNDGVELPQQLVNCCAAYQALLQKRQQEREGSQSSADEEDRLDVDMARLSAAVQAVDGMLDEIDRLLKTEELGDSEYRRTVGRPYDYSAGRMRELRREASRYREAHVGRARDSWVTLSRAVRERRRRDLELLALPPVELAARLPPARPELSSITAEVAASGAVNLSSSYNAEVSSDQNDDSESDSESSNCGLLRQFQQESLERLGRLNMVVNKMQEAYEQRKELLIVIREEMELEDKNSAVAGQYKVDVLGELRGSEDSVRDAVKKKLYDYYGNLVDFMKRNVAAQVNILDAVRASYARAAPERRAYANAMQRRRTLVASLLDAYESFAAANGGPSVKTSNESMVAASPTSGLLPDEVLAERCAKGLDFYQRMLTNVSKLLQRVKGTCQVQTEQRDQIIKQHHQWEATTQQSDDDLATTVGGLDDFLGNVSTVDNQAQHQDDLTALVESFGSSGVLNKHPTPLGRGHWDQQHHLRRLSPLGSEQQQQQQYHQYCHPQIQPQSTNFTTGVGTDYYDYYYYNNHRSATNKMYSGHDGSVHVSSSQQQPMAVMSSHVTYPTYNVVGSTALVASINSTSTSLTSPLSSSSMPYNYYNYLPTDTLAVNPILPSNSYNNIVTATSASTTDMMNALHLGTKNSANSIRDDGSSGVFTNTASAVAVLQQPLPVQYSCGSNSSISNIGYSTTSGFDHHIPATMLSSRHQQLYPQQYQQQISTAAAVSGNVTGIGTAGLLQQHQLTAGDSSGSSGVQSPISSPFISTTIVNNCGISAAIQSSNTSVSDTSIASNFCQQSLPQQQQQLYHQQQQSQLYQQQQQEQQPLIYQQQQQQQQPQLYQQQPQIYQQEQQQQQLQSQIYEQHQAHQLTTTGGNDPSKLYYSSQQQQQTSQLFQPTAVLTTAAVTANLHQPPLLLNNIGKVSGSSYYQPLPHYHPLTTMAPATPLNTNTTTLNNFYYQQPTMAATAFNQHQQQQQYYQQQHPSVGGGMTAVTSTTSPVLNLLDDDLQLSGPPPIQPEKISGSSNGCEGDTKSSSSSSATNSSK